MNVWVVKCRRRCEVSVRVIYRSIASRILADGCWRKCSHQRSGRRDFGSARWAPDAALCPSTARRYVAVMATANMASGRAGRYVTQHHLSSGPEIKPIKSRDWLAVCELVTITFSGRLLVTVSPRCWRRFTLYARLRLAKTSACIALYYRIQMERRRLTCRLGFAKLRVDADWEIPCHSHHILRIGLLSSLGFRLLLQSRLTTQKSY